MSYVLTRGRIVVVLLALAACENEPGRVSGSGGRSGDAEAGASGATDTSERLRGACAALCELDLVLSTSCAPGDLIVAGELERREAGGAGGGAGASTAATTDPLCVTECMQGVKPEECESPFVAAVDCWRQTVWVCSEPGDTWGASECESVVEKLTACLSP